MLQIIFSPVALEAEVGGRTEQDAVVTMQAISRGGEFATSVSDGRCSLEHLEEMGNCSFSSYSRASFYSVSYPDALLSHCLPHQLLTAKLGGFRGL